MGDATEDNPMNHATEIIIEHGFGGTKRTCGRVQAISAQDSS